MICFCRSNAEICRCNRWLGQVYCPKSGFLKLLIEDNPKSKGHATDEDKDSLSSCIFDIDVDLKECSLLPGSEVERN